MKKDSDQIQVLVKFRKLNLLDVVDFGSGEFKQMKYLSLPRGVVIWRRKTPQLNGSRLIIKFIFSSRFSALHAFEGASN